MNHTHTDHIEDKIINVLTGRASQEELLEIRKWLSINEENREVYDEYVTTWIAGGMIGRKNDFQADAAWTKLSKKMKKTYYAEYRIPWGKIAVAAMIAVVILSGMMIYNISNEAHINEDSLAYTEYSSPYGSKSQVKLPDGSNVWLNAGSILRYSSDFNKNVREIYLEGEGYFDVARNEQKPFLVQTSTIAIKVLGTAFNVKAYPEESIVETTVERGKVQLLEPLTTSQGTTILQANQKAVVIKNMPAVIQMKEIGKTEKMKIKPPKYIPIAKMEVSSNIKVEAYTSWKDTRWIIESEKLADLAVKLERRYNIHIVFDDEELKNYVFSGKFENETLDEVLEVMKLSAPILYKTKQNMVYMSRNKMFQEVNSKQ